MAPCFLLRDGRKQRFEQVPDGLALYRYQDQAGQDIQALLDPASQRRLLGAQPQPRPHGLSLNAGKVRPLRRLHQQNPRRSA
jgi:hypothetical protein